MGSRGVHRWAFLAWGLTLLGGMALLVRYASTPGVEARPPAQWPASTKVRLHADGRSTLLLFVHPKCPCSRATLAEVAGVLERHRGRVALSVIFVLPEGVPAGWERTRLWDEATALPGATLEIDVRGREAARFGARTSGQVLLYAGDGRLRFSGGVTAARGHEGRNPGQAALEAAIDVPSGAPVRMPVFGCPLLSPAPSKGPDG